MPACSLWAGPQAGVPIEAVLFARADGVRRPRVLLVGQQHGDEPAAARRCS